MSGSGGGRFDVVGIGYNTVDHVFVTPRPAIFDRKQRVADYFRQPGGQVPTALVALQSWGLRCAYVGPFGDDEGGRVQRDSLAAAGVDLRHCAVRTGVASETSFIAVDAVTGERTIHWHRPAGLRLRREDIDDAIPRHTRALLMDAADVELAIALARQARAAGALVMLDIDEPGGRCADLLAHCDAVIVSGDFPQRLTELSDLGAALRRMGRMGPRLVAATLGAGGAMACAGGRLHHQPPVAARVVDTTSAGDLFHAGCLYGLLRGWTVPRGLRFAAVAAALTCEKLGGRAAIPTLRQIEVRNRLLQGR
jgi:sulfofructose kinase